MGLKANTVYVFVVVCIIGVFGRPQAVGDMKNEVTAKPYQHQQCVIRTGHPTECHEFREAEAKRHKTYLQAVHDKNWTLANQLAEPFAVFKSETAGPASATMAPTAKPFVAKSCTPKPGAVQTCNWSGLDIEFEAKRYTQYLNAIKEGDIEEANLMALTASSDSYEMSQEFPLSSETYSASSED